MRTKNILFIGALLLMAALLPMGAAFGEGGANPGSLNPDNLGALLSIAYSYGSHSSAQWDFAIAAQPAGGSGEREYRFSAKGTNFANVDVEGVVDQTVMDTLEALIKNHGVLQWNGWSESNSLSSDVLDGYSFKLRAKFENGELLAEGYEAYPETYSLGHAALSAFLEGLADSALNGERKEIARIDLIRSPSFGPSDEMGGTVITVYPDPALAALVYEQGFFHMPEHIETDVLDGDLTTIQVVFLSGERVSVGGYAADDEGPEAFVALWNAVMEAYGEEN
jgi:hypothetical protein